MNIHSQTGSERKQTAYLAPLLQQFMSDKISRDLFVV